MSKPKPSLIRAATKIRALQEAPVKNKSPAKKKASIDTSAARLCAPPRSIGTQNESSLHKALKLHYTGSEGAVEAPVGGYICDGRTSRGELIEVQCGSFAPLKEKVAELALKHKIKVIHPIIAEKYIELYDTSGILLHRRKSPRKGSEWDLFYALMYAPLLPLLKNFSIELAFVEIVERRENDGKGSWRRKKVSITGKTLQAVRGSLVLAKPKDYNRFIPFKKSESFTVRTFAEKAGIDKVLAEKTLYVLTKLGLTQRTGRKGRAHVYERM
ncbi:MAG: hypothetical protein FWD91_03195 [Treponema sp.]|nr:hypothetical protein [Treponema sp.]